MAMQLKRLANTEGEANDKSPRVTLYYKLILSGSDVYTLANASTVETAVDTYLDANLPTSYDGRTEISRRVTMGYRVVKVSVTYDTAGTGQNKPVTSLAGGASDGFTPPSATGAGTSAPAVTDPLDQSITIGLGQGSDTIKRSFQTLEIGSRTNGYFGVTIRVPNYHNFINVTTKDGQIEVGDLQIPWGRYITFDVSRKVAAVDIAYSITLERLLFTTNIKSWFGHPAGTLLFLGAQFQYADGGWKGSYKFAKRSNVKAQTLELDTGSEFAMPAYRAWDYLWVHYDYVKDPATGLMLPCPHSWLLEQVVPYADFALLRIGASSGSAVTGVLTINDLQI